jgi:hypothetical protein
MPNPNFDSMLSTTIDAYVPVLVDNAFSSKPLLWVLKNEGRIQNKEGGNKCVVPLLYAESNNVGSYSGSDTFTTDADDNITAAEYNWKQFYGLFLVQGIEKSKNAGGKTQVIDLIKARAKATEMTISERLDEQFFGDGSGNGNKDFLGLSAIVSASDPASGDLGGIDAATNSWWQSTVDSTAETIATWGLGGVSEMWNTVSEGNDHPTHLFTTAVLFGAFEAILTANARYMDPEVGDAGFQNLLVKGVPLVFDKYCQTGRLYMININYITLYTLDNVWFEPSEFITPPNQDVSYKFLKLYGALTTDNRKRHGVHTAFTG